MDSPLTLRKTPKNDTIGKVYFLVQGVGTLISWNGVLNGLDYFSDRYPNQNVDFLLPLAFNVAQVIANFFMPILSTSFSLKYRIIAPLIITSCVLVFLPFEANVFNGQVVGFWLVMGMLFIMGFCNCVYQGSVSGFASLFPFKYTSYFLMGTGLAGLVMNALRALAIVGFSNMTGGALIEIVVYFGMAGLILIACVLLHPVFVRSSFCQYYLELSKVGPDTMNEIEEDSEMTLEPKSSETKRKQSLKYLLSVLWQVKFFFMILVLNYTQTFLVYPGVMLEKPLTALSADWKVVSMITAYNLFDVIGKNLAQYRRLYNKTIIVMITLFRFTFDAFFIIQAITSNIAVFNTIWFAYVNIALFGLTNGFVTTVSFIMCPEKVTSKRKETAGFLSVFGLTTGLTVGGFIALALGNLNANNN